MGQLGKPFPVSLGRLKGDTAIFVSNRLTPLAGGKFNFSAGRSATAVKPRHRYAS